MHPALYDQNLIRNQLRKSDSTVFDRALRVPNTQRNNYSFGEIATNFGISDILLVLSLMKRCDVSCFMVTFWGYILNK